MNRIKAWLMVILFMCIMNIMKELYWFYPSIGWAFVLNNTRRNNTLKLSSHAAVVKALPEKKIAFLFLLSKEFETSEIWYRYFANAPAKQWTLYLHVDPNQTIANMPVFFEQFLLKPEYQRRTVYCQDLISATLALIQAALEDIHNHKFILLSPTHVPLRKFSELRLSLIRDNASWICVTPVAQWASVETGHERPKHHQWIILSYAEASRQLRLDRKPTENMRGCEDEYLITPPELHGSLNYTQERVWSDVNQGGLRITDTSGERLLVEQGLCSTYVHWGDYHENSLFQGALPYWFDTSVDINHQLNPVSYCFLLGLQQHTDFLFARKVVPTARVSMKCTGGENATDLAVLEALIRLDIIRD